MEKMWNLRLPSRLKAKYESQLNAREKTAIILGFSGLLIFLLIQLVYTPMLDRRNLLAQGNRIKEKDLMNLKTIVAQYKNLEQYREGTGRGTQTSSVNLFSILEGGATECGLKDKIDYMRPGDLQVDSRRVEKWVEMKLSRITLKDLTRYLYILQSSQQGIYIKRLSSRKEGEYLELILQPAIMETK